MKKTIEYFDGMVRNRASFTQGDTETSLLSYIEFLGIYKALSRAERDVLYQMVVSMDRRGYLYELGIFKERCGRECGLTVGTVDKCIQEISNKGLFLREEKGLYRVSPVYFGLGVREAEVIRFSIEFRR